MLIAENRLAAYSGARQRQQDAYNAETFSLGPRRPGGGAQGGASGSTRGISE